MDHTYLPKLLWKTKQTSNFLYIYIIWNRWGFVFYITERMYLGLHSTI